VLLEGKKRRGTFVEAHKRFGASLSRKAGDLASLVPAPAMAVNIDVGVGRAQI